MRGNGGGFFRRFMTGRYGTDKLNTRILGAGLILCLVSEGGLHLRWWLIDLNSEDIRIRSS